MELINTRSINCIYCDDVRHEVGGKIMLVGMYPEGMQVQFPPQGTLTLPKLCIIANIRIPADQPVQFLRCELRLDDDVLHAVVVPDEVFNANASARKNQKWIEVQMIMQLGNFIIKNEGTLRFVAIFEETQIYESQGLKFKKTETQTATSTPETSAT